MNVAAGDASPDAVRVMSRDMFRIVRLQLIAAIVVGLIAWSVSGSAALVSVWLGAAACLIPNAWFALRIRASMLRPGNYGPATLLAGEMIKLLASVALIAVVAVWYDNMVWWALVLGIVTVLKGYLFALVWN